MTLTLSQPLKSIIRFICLSFFLVPIGCETNSYLLGDFGDTLLFEADSFNYHETKPLLGSPDLSLSSVEENKATLIFENSKQKESAPQSAFARLGCQKILFTFDNDFIGEGEKVPYKFSFNLRINQNKAKVKGTGIAIGRIAFFVVNQTEDIIIARKILDEVTALDNSEELSKFHNLKQEFVLTVPLETQTEYAFYIELLGKLESFKENSICQSSIQCTLSEISIYQE